MIIGINIFNISQQGISTLDISIYNKNIYNLSILSTNTSYINILDSNIYNINISGTSIGPYINSSIIYFWLCQ